MGGNPGTGPIDVRGGTVKYRGRPSAKPVKDIRNQFDRCVESLERTGILEPLEGSGGAGVVGIDGREYPPPTLDQLLGLLERNGELVARKAAQGFTRLLLTPVAMPVPRLIDRVNGYVRQRSDPGPLLRTKAHPGDPDVPTTLSKKEPVWIWQRVLAAMDTPEVVYFPTSYDIDRHGGVAKEEVLRDPRRCAVPGWSVGLVEPIPIMPRRGEGQVLGGRGQLEAGSTPTEYLGLLGTPPYRGETGWTIEDLMVQFVTRVERTGEVSHDRFDGNALFLLGMYMPRVMRRALLVPTANWGSERGRRLYIGAHRTNNRFAICVGRSIVRLPR